MDPTATTGLATRRRTGWRSALACLALVGSGWVTRAADAPPELTIPRLDTAPTLEDFLGMGPSREFEGKLKRVEGFIQQTPSDGQPSGQTTHVYLGYDDERLYCIFVAFDDEPEKIRAHLGRRETLFGDDIVEIMLDPFNDRQRAYAFVVNPLGVQWDAIWTEGRRDSFDGSWDAVWSSRGRLTERGYVVWIAIPFKSLRFPARAEQTWALVLARDIQRDSENTFWPRISNRIEGRLNQAATLHGLRDISPGRNLLLIPYATAGAFRLRDDAGEVIARNDFDPDGGLDAKLVLRDSLALDLTANPDFSQVESDEPQVTVNERFEVFFPEKRPFFLENAGLFETQLNLLFTRRIVDPRAGARLSGKLGAYTLGALLIDDEAPGKLAAPGDPLDGESARNAVLRFARDLPNQSSLGLMFTDRELAGSTNRVGGFDGRFKLGDHWDTRFQAVYAATETTDGERLDDPAFTLEFNRTGRKFRGHFDYMDIGKEFRTDTGFVRRVDLRNYHQSTGYTFRPEGPRLVSWGPTLFVERIEDQDGTRLDRGVVPEIAFEWRGQTKLEIAYRHGRERLRPEDLPDDAPVSLALDFPRESVDVEFDTKVLKSFTFGTELSVGEGINFVPPVGELPAAADRLAAQAEVTARVGKRWRLDLAYLRTALDDRGTDRRVLTDDIARARLNFQFDPRLSLRLIAQYESTRTNPELTRLDDRRGLNADFLATYLINPWSAVYLGYNANYRELDDPMAPVRLRGELRNDARLVFLKLSYLFTP